MRLTLLGQIAIVTDTGAITALPHRATWRLLARLALARESTLPRSEIEVILQSEGSVRAPNTLLRQLLFRLREKLSADIIVREEGSLRLVIPCDAAEFIATIRKVERAREESYRTGLLQRSLSLYAGSFMPGFKETWAEELAEELEAKYLWAKAELGLAEEEEGEEKMSVKLVGRGQELARLEELLSKERFVTLVGPGGAGKTRLARELVRKDRASVVVNLVEVKTAEAVAPAILSTLGLPPSGSIEAYFSSRPDALLVLDNAEHLVSPELRGALSQLLTETEATGLRILTTSRRALDTPFERVFPLGMLPTPPEKPEGYWAKNRDALLAYPSAQLFCEQAKRTKRGWDIARSGDNIAEICRRVDGSPLALLLIASRINVFNPTELANKKLFALLEAKRSFPGDRERHGNLRDVINWSVAQLSPSQTAVFASLSEFAGSFSTEAAQYITDTPNIEQDLESLAAENLLERDDSDKARPRWRFHQTIKERALELVEQLATGDTTRKRFLRYYRDLTERAAPHLRTRKGKVWLDHLEQEHANLKKAITLSPTEEALGIGISLLDFYRYRGHFQEGITELSSLLQNKKGDLRMNALLALSELQIIKGDLHSAIYNSEEVLISSRLNKDNLRSAHSLLIIGTAEHHFNQKGNNPEIKVNESLKIYQSTGYKKGEAGCLNILGLRLRDNHKLEESRKYHTSALRIYRSIDDIAGQATQLANLAKTYSLPATYRLNQDRDLPLQQRLERDTTIKTDFKLAYDLFLQSQAVWRQYGSTLNQATTNVSMMWSVYFTRGERAHIECLQEAVKILFELNEKPYLFIALFYLLQRISENGIQSKGSKKIESYIKFIKLHAAMTTHFSDEYYQRDGHGSRAQMYQYIYDNFIHAFSTKERFDQIWQSGLQLSLSEIVSDILKIKPTNDLSTD